MKPLYKLSFLKLKSKIRNIFSRPLPAILTVVAVLIYGGTAISMFFIPHEVSDTLFNMAGDIGTNLLFLALVGFSALMMFSTLANNRKALFFQDDAFYLFTSPFTFKQIISYLAIVDLLNAIMFSVVTIYMAIIFSMGTFSAGLLFIMFLFLVIIQLFFMLMVDYFYILELIHPKTKPLKWVVIGVITGATLLLVAGYIFSNDFNIVEGVQDFALSNYFHFIPIFGWLKYGLIALYEHNYLTAALIGLVFMALVVVVYILLTHIKGDFYAEALEDAVKATKYMQAAKQGKMLNTKEKVHNGSVDFKLGEWAILSKNILLLKKTRDFIRKQDLFIIVVYLLMAYFIGVNNTSGYTMYSYMMVVWTMASILQSTIGSELKNYYIYLIPGNPFKKMIATVVPLLLKPLSMMLLAYLLGGIVFRESPATIITAIVQYVSVMFVMVAGNVLSVRIMKSQNNPLVENILRMITMLISFVPVIIILVMIGMIIGFEQLIPIVPLVMTIVNMIMAIAILLICAPMLNGTEIALSEEE